MFDSTPTVGWSQTFSDAGFVQNSFDSIRKFIICLIRKEKNNSKNSIKINSKFVRFDSTSISYRKLNKSHLVSDLWRKSNPGFFCDWPDIENREGESTIVFSVQNPFKVHEKTRCVSNCANPRTWAAFFDNFDAFSKKREKRKGKKDEKEISGRAKSKNAVNLIWCTSFFKTF